MNNQNLYHDIKDVTGESGLPEEPVTVQDCKDFMRLEGFVDADESTTESLSHFLADDELIEDMITAARKKAEKYCGISIVYHEFQAVLTNCAGDIEIPYGPIRTITSASYKNGQVFTSSVWQLTGLDFLTIDTPNSERMVWSYEAGYEDVPEEICLAIKQMVFYWYDQRQIGNIPELALNTLMPFKRAWTWLA